MNLVFFGGFHFPVPGPSDSPCDSTLFVERGEWLPENLFRIRCVDTEFLGRQHFAESLCQQQMSFCRGFLY